MTAHKKLKKIPRKSMTMCRHYVTYRNYWGTDLLIGQFINEQEADAFLNSVCAYFSLPPETRGGSLWQKLNVERG